VKTVLEVLGVLVDPNTFVSFNCETRVDPQHLRGFGFRLLKSSQLRVGGRQNKMRRLQIGHARCVFVAQAHRLPIALEQVIRQTHLAKRGGPRKGVEADTCLQYLERSFGLARIVQSYGVSIVDEIGIEREGALEFGDGGVVAALEKQDEGSM